ncbi:MAG: ABC transporter permease [Enterocloster sp.]
MVKFIVKRLLWVIPVLLGASFLIFSLLHASPGDPAITSLGITATQEELDQFNEMHNLNDPLLVQYGKYIYNLAEKGDFGRSYRTNDSVLPRIQDAWPATMKMAGFASVIMILIGVPLGILSAIRQYSILDNFASVFGMAGVSMPNFWLGLQLMIIFALNLRWLPASGYSGFRYLILPAVTIGLAGAASLMRITRSSMLEVIRQDYIRTARAKGQSERVIIWHHMLRNFPSSDCYGKVALQFVNLMGNAIVVETIFSIPGISKLMIDGINARDYPHGAGEPVLVIAFIRCIAEIF